MVYTTHYRTLELMYNTEEIREIMERGTENNGLDNSMQNQEDMITADELLIYMYDMISDHKEKFGNITYIFPFDKIKYSDIRNEVWLIMHNYIYGTIFESDYQEKLYIMLRNRLYNELKCNQRYLDI